MNERQIKIIKELLRKNESTISDLAIVSSVSYRTIQSDIQSINSVLNRNGATIITKTNKGVFLEINDIVAFDNYKSNLNVNEKNEISNYSEISYSILNLFVNKMDYIKSEDIITQFFISKSVYQKCMNDLKIRVNEYNLEFISKPFYGTFLSGSEHDIRKMILDIKSIKSDFFPLEIDSIKQSFIKNYLSDFCKKNQLNITEESLNELLLAIFIAATRIKHNYYIDISNKEESYFFEMNEFQYASEICKFITSKVYVPYHINEVCYMCKLLSGHIRLSMSHIEQLESTVREDLDSLIIKIMDEIEEKYHLDFHNDVDLYVALGMHLIPLVSRIRFDLHINNPIVKDIKRYYSLAFDMAVTISKLIENDFDIRLSEDEIGYLALHFNLAVARKNTDIKPKNILVVCSSGGGLSKLLEFKIYQNFNGYVNKVKSVNMFELKKMDISEFDYVLTTVQLDYTLAKPTLQISHMLTRNDVERVKLVFTKEKTLLDVAKEEYFLNDIKASTVEETIHIICDNLSKHLPLQTDFVEQVLAREELYSTEIGNNIVFPHPLISKTPVTFVSVNILKKPIRWKNEFIQVVLIGNTKVGESQDLQIMYQEFAEFVSNQQNVIELIKNPSYETFKKIVEKR